MHPSQCPVYTTGSWAAVPRAGGGAFIAAWEEFAGWAAGRDGAGDAILARDVRAEGRYVSFLGWDDMEAVRGWKGHPEFKERMSRVQQFVDKFAPTELEVVARGQG